MKSFSESPARRLPVVEVMYAMGVSDLQIAAVLGCSQPTITHDVVLLGGDRFFLDRPKGNDVFVSVLKRYAAMVWSSCGDDWEAFKTSNGSRSDLWIALAKWLGEEAIIIKLRGVAETFGRLIVPDYAPIHAGHARLLYDIFDLKYFRSSVFFSFDNSGWKLWHEMLWAVNAGEKKPDSRRELNDLLIQRALDIFRADIMPTWGEEVVVVVECLLATLSSDVETIIHLLYGIHPYQPVKEVDLAAGRGVTVSAISSVRARVLRQMKESLVQSGLYTLAFPVNELLTTQIARQVEKDELERLLLGVSWKDRALFQELGSLGLSTRTMNRLNLARLCLLGQVAQKSEQELLRMKSFGRRSLKEIVDVLELHNLTFGMQLSADLHERISTRLNQLSDRG